jgi:hypothetical protein
MEIFAKVVTNSWYITPVLGNFSPLLHSCVAPSNINTHLREYFPYVTNAVNHILHHEYLHILYYTVYGEYVFAKIPPLPFL